jgi:uncharacterized protein YndB with AHSA1/START domain
MSSLTANAQPAHVLEVLTDPTACGRWAPIAFTTEPACGERLQVGTRTRLQGRIVGRNVSFEVEVLAADARGLSLCASGPVGLEVDYRLTPAAPGTRPGCVRESGLARRRTPARVGGGGLKHRARAEPNN